MTIPINGSFSLADLERIWLGPAQLSLAANCQQAVLASHASLDQILSSNKTVYGINTGFGKLAHHKIPDHELALLQKYLVQSHAAGTGEYLSDEIVRLIIALKINSLARGYSGVRLEVVQALIDLFNHEIYPCIPAKGSVGASGDLAPLAHLSCALIGDGMVRHHGKLYPAPEGLALAKIKTLTLGPKEGLALLNGTQASTALALSGLFRAQNLFGCAVLSGSLAVEAAAASHAPFDARIQEVRGQRGQIDVAAAYRDLLADSPIQQSHVNCDRVQDPYSLRCQPQVMGACLTQLRYVAEVLLTEANAVTDNPLIFADGVSLSGGNFHAEPVALTADGVAVVLAEIGNITERRIALLNDASMNGDLPAFLIPNPGINSGFMIAHVTAAALASENKTLSHPAAVDTIPTSANQEDHVSMATFAARRLHQMCDNLADIISVEFLCATQGLDMRHPLRTSKRLMPVHDLVRQHVPFFKHDRLMAPAIDAVTRLIHQREFMKFFPVL